MTSMYLRDLNKPLPSIKRDKSQHNTLRYGQVERRRKLRKRAAKKLPRYRYVKFPVELRE